MAMDGRFTCQICKRSFTQKSSLIRHSKRCTPGPAPSLRQKSCRQCTSSKTKCDLQRPKCSRCEQRNTACEYVVPLTRGIQTQSPPEEDSDISSNDQEDMNNTLVTVSDLAVNLTEAPQTLSANTAFSLNLPTAGFDFADQQTNFGATSFQLPLDKYPTADLAWNFPNTFDPFATSLPASITQSNLMLPITNAESSPDGEEFNAENLFLWNTAPPKSTPPLVRHSMETLLRVMKTWPKALAKGFQTPPMLHFTHTHSRSILWPMVRCIAMAKMWANQSDGSTEVVRQTVIQEMRSLFEQYRSMDERHLLAALQALVMYTLIIMFPGRGQISVALVDPAIFLCLQRVVSYVAKTGLLLTEERDCLRPSWESWVHVTAKRRAVFTLYLVHWSYSVYHNLESFACSQLGFMPAPAPKFLWQAETKEKWEDLYTQWLAQWGDYPYMMHEFAAIQMGTALEQRTERWLEDADELGVLFFSIVNATERGDLISDYGGGIPVLTT